MWALEAQYQNALGWSLQELLLFGLEKLESLQNIYCCHYVVQSVNKSSKLNSQNMLSPLQNDTYDSFLIWSLLGSTYTLFYDLIPQ